MDARLLEILVCPLCKGPLDYLKDKQELVCKADRLAFRFGRHPVMLDEEARTMSAEEVDALRK